MEFVSFLAPVLGGFYVFSGLVTVWAAAQERFRDPASTATGTRTIARPEQIRVVTMFAIGLSTVIGGLFLVGLSRWATHAFVVCATIQAVYLIWASGALKPASPLEQLGRRRTRNAFFVYLMTTGYVISLYYRGVLT